MGELDSADAYVVRPLARREGLLSAELDGEVLIYDEDREMACRLNRTAAQVWRLSDGERTVAELADLVSEERPDVDLVLVALDQLRESGLLEDGYPERDTETVELDRRRFMKRLGAVGAAAAIVPVVEAVAMPTAARGADPPPPGSPLPPPPP